MPTLMCLKSSSKFTRRLLALSFIWMSFNSLLLAQSITVKDAMDAPTPIAIQTFLKGAETPDAVKAASDLEAALTADLIFSRIFKVLPSDSFLEPKITSIDSFQPATWKQIGASYVVRAKVSIAGPVTFLDGYVFDVLTGRPSIKKTYRTQRKDISILSHQFGDDIVELVTGKPGLFSTKIAFSYIPPRGKDKEIWVMDFNGRNAYPLVQNGRTNLSPEWTRDGRFVYYSSSSLIDWHLWRTDLSGHSKQVTNFKGSALGPAMLPNGRELLISLSKDGNADIYILDLEGKEKRRLTARQGINVSPYSSPDGTRICFSSDRLGNLHVFSLNLDTAEMVRLTRVGTKNDSCVWGPDGRILFSGMDTDRMFDLFSMNEAGEDMSRLTYDASNNESPSFSPDGKLVVFSSARSGRNQLYIMKADGTKLEPIQLPGDATQPAWSPRLGY